MYIFQDTQIVGSIIKQFPAMTTLNQGNLDKEVYDDILEHNSNFLNILLKEPYNLVKMHHQIVGRKTKNDLYFLQPQFTKSKYQLIPDKEPKTLLKYNLGDIYKKDIIGKYYIFNVEYRFDGVYYWICYPDMVKSSANRRVHEDKMDEYNVDFDKVLLKKNVIVQDTETSTKYMILSLDDDCYDWSIQNIVLAGLYNNCNIIKVSKEYLLSRFDMITLDESLYNLKEIDTTLI